MKHSILNLTLGLSLGLLATPPAHAAKLFSCHYTYQVMPFVDISIGVSDDGKLDNYVTATAEGSSHRESAAAMACQVGELYHIVISKEDPENMIYMIIYEPKTDNTYPSDLINPQMPAGVQTVSGTCTVSVTE